MTTEGAESQKARKLDVSLSRLYRSSRLSSNMLDGLKMEENFQSAIETSASFSSLLGKCSTPFTLTHPAAARLGGSSGRQLAGTGLGNQASTLFVHVAAPTLSSMSISPFESSLPYNQQASSGLRSSTLNSPKP